MRNKRLIVPVLAGVVVFGTVSGFAASLNLTSDSLGSGQTAVTSCAPVGATLPVVDVTYGTSFGAGAYRVDTVTFSAPAACQGLPFQATLLSGTSVVGTVSGTISATAHPVTAAAPAASVSAASVDGLAVVIAG